MGLLGALVTMITLNLPRTRSASSAAAAERYDMGRNWAPPSTSGLMASPDQNACSPPPTGNMAALTCNITSGELTWLIASGGDITPCPRVDDASEANQVAAPGSRARPIPWPSFGASAVERTGRAQFSQQQRQVRSPRLPANQ